MKMRFDSQSKNQVLLTPKNPLIETMDCVKLIIIDY